MFEVGVMGGCSEVIVSGRSPATSRSNYDFFFIDILGVETCEGFYRVETFNISVIVIFLYIKPFFNLFSMITYIICIIKLGGIVCRCQTTILI